MKGQFFVIASVIIISALIMIIQFFYDYGKSDLTIVQEMKETEYIGMVKDSLIETTEITLNNFGCSDLDANLKDTEDFLKDQLISKGITLKAEHDTTNCPTNIDFSFTLSTTNFLSETEFSYP